MQKSHFIVDNSPQWKQNKPVSLSMESEQRAPLSFVLVSCLEQVKGEAHELCMPLHPCQLIPCRLSTINCFRCTTCCHSDSLSGAVTLLPWDANMLLFERYLPRRSKHLISIPYQFGSVYFQLFRKCILACNNESTAWENLLSTVMMPDDLLLLHKWWFSPHWWVPHLGFVRMGASWENVKVGGLHHSGRALLTPASISPAMHCGSVYPCIKLSVENWFQ